MFGRILLIGGAVALAAGYFIKRAKGKPTEPEAPPTPPHLTYVEAIDTGEPTSYVGPTTMQFRLAGITRLKRRGF